MEHTQFKVIVKKKSWWMGTLVDPFSLCHEDGGQDFFWACLAAFPKKILAAANGKVH
jgi:hypothetical protein